MNGSNINNVLKIPRNNAITFIHNRYANMLAVIITLRCQNP